MSSMRERMARAMLERAKGKDLYFYGLLVREAAIDTKLHPSWLGHMAYELMIRAIKEGK